MKPAVCASYEHQIDKNEAEIAEHKDDEQRTVFERNL